VTHPIVAVSRCALDSSDLTIEEAVRASIALAGGVPERVRMARRILVKPNYVGASGKPSDDAIKRHGGRLVSCTEPAISRAVVKLVREINPTAEILFAEGIDARPPRTALDVFRALGALPLVDDFGVQLLDANAGEIVAVPVPGGGLLNRMVYLRRELAEVDGVISVAKLKAHGTAGVTMSIKNMFGALPSARYGSTFRNFMHTNYFRLMRIIVDTATRLRPDLAIIDGLVASNHGMDGTPVEMNVLLAGHDPVATDAVGAAIMGFDPRAEMPTEPFLVAENHLRLAALAGLGTLDLVGTEVRGVSIADVARHFSIQTESNVSTEQAVAARRAAVEQAAVFCVRREELLRQYADQYVFLYDGDVEWSTPSLGEAADRAVRLLPTGHYGLAIQVLSEDREIERAGAYSIGPS